jgi:hypothetical protein
MEDVGQWGKGQEKQQQDKFKNGKIITENWP